MTGARWVGAILILALVVRLFFLFLQPSQIGEGLRLFAVVGVMVVWASVWVLIRTPKQRGVGTLSSEADQRTTTFSNAVTSANPAADAEYEFLLLNTDLPVLLVTIPGDAAARGELFDTLMRQGWAVIEPPLSSGLGGRATHSITFDDRDLLFRQHDSSRGSAPFSRAHLIGPIIAGWGAATRAQNSAPLLLLRVGGSTPTPLNALNELALRRELIGARVGVVSRNTAG